MRARALTASALLCLLLALSGCGGGGESESTGSPASAGGTQTAQGNPANGEDEPGEGQGTEAESAPQGESHTERSSAEPDPPIATERTPGSKAVAPEVPVTKGGDNSIQAFGSEGEEAEAEQATETLEAYLNARANKDWSAACEQASSQLREELVKLVEQAKAKGDTEKPRGCAETLALFFGKAPAQTLQEAARIDRVLSFRVREDGYAYLIYEAEGKVKFIAMANDDGTWRPNTLEPQAFQGPQGENQ